jgi:predicted RNase H-like HicB family nuclease
MKKAYKVAMIPEDDGCAVYVPAFDGWTQGKDLADALYMAKDYIELMGAALEDDGEQIPDDVPYQAKDGEIESYVYVDFAPGL